MRKVNIRAIHSEVVDILALNLEKLCFKQKICGVVKNMLVFLQMKIYRPVGVCVNVCLCECVYVCVCLCVFVCGCGCTQDSVCICLDACMCSMYIYTM